jgi:hypothetical protein
MHPIVLNASKFVHLAIAATAIVGGVVSKNSAEQMGQPNHPVMEPLGWILFFGGWIYLAFISGQHTSKFPLYWFASAGVMASVYFMKRAMEQYQTPNMVFPAMFVLSWLGLGWLAGMRHSGMLKYAGLISAALVIMSMMWALPEQRGRCIVDGPGMPMFVIAWVIYIMLSSMSTRAMHHA